MLCHCQTMSCHLQINELKKQMQHEIIFFDLDGTLVETAPEIMDAVNDTLSYFDWPCVTQSLVEEWIGHGTKELLIKAIALVTHQTEQDARVSPELKDALPVFERHYQLRCGTRSQLYPYVREALAHLRADGVKLVVMTNKEGIYTQILLREQNLIDAFDMVISGDTFKVKKPDPTGVELCLNRWGISKVKALFVGDSSIDAATAKNAGISVWLLPYGYNMGAHISACMPDRVVADFSEFIK